MCEALYEFLDRNGRMIRALFWFQFPLCFNSCPTDRQKHLLSKPTYRTKYIRSNQPSGKWVALCLFASLKKSTCGPLLTDEMLLQHFFVDDDDKNGDSTGAASGFALELFCSLFYHGIYD